MQLKKILQCCFEDQDQSSSIEPPPSNTTNIDDIRMESPATSTFEHQESLPRLPIPSLSATLARFTETIKPLLSAAELEEAKSIIKDFGENDGPKLQSLLESYEAKAAREGSYGSYIEKFWSDAYLQPDASVVLNLNPYFLLEGDADAKIAKDQIKRAAALTFCSLKFAASLKNETMKPDVIKGIPLCMDQFKSLFGACRIPKKGTDVIQVDSESSHVVVMYRNQFYYFHGLWSKSVDSNGEVKVAVNEADIAQILLTIVKDAKRVSKAASVEKALGVLTTLNRNDWASAREKLTRLSQSNKNNLQIIESALFVLALDEFVPENVHEAAANMLHGTHKLVPSDEDDNIVLSSRNLLPSLAFQGGTCCNRFYDKLQIIVCEDGSAGINFEHSAIDGHTALRFVSDVFADTIVNFAKSVTKAIYTKGCPIPSILNAQVTRAMISNKGKDKNDRTYFDTSPKKLNFDFNAEIFDEIVFAEAKLGDTVKGDETNILEFKNFGKNLIVHNSLSPDSFVQMTIMIAYYRLYGEVVNSYESVLTKRFFHGRTEAMRSTTTLAKRLMKCWSSQASSEEEKLSALRDACKSHSKLVKEAAAGYGVDRHLYALKCIGEQNDTRPDLFTSEAWSALNHTVLSTSNCGNPSLRLFGFGPVVPDGFGIGYIIKDFGLQYSISSKHRQTQRYALSLHETLLEMEELLQPLDAQEMGTTPGDRRRKSLFRMSKN